MSDAQNQTYRDNLFGTDGIRAQMGSIPLSLEHLPQLGKAIGTWAHNKYNKKPAALIAHDTRLSCALVKSALASGLLSKGITLYDAHILPTAAVCTLVEQHTLFDFGIIISASHNHYKDNGIKLIDATNNKLALSDEEMISQLFYSEKTDLNYEQLGSLYPWPQGYDAYLKTIINKFKPNFLHGITVVLDCSHGATYKLAPHIFEQLGARTIIINAQPNGANINENCGSLFPQSLQSAILTHKADIGFSFDGDGDRVTVVSKHGEIKNGDDIIALLLDHPLYADQTHVVGTIMSNQGLAAHLESKNKTLIRTHVGDKYVSKEMIQQHLLLGGEQSGHIILRDYLNVGDGIFTALRILETALLTNNWLLNTFIKYPQFLINIPVQIKRDLTQPDLANIITSYKSQLYKGRLEVRYSGTENLLRIMVEDSDDLMAKNIGDQVSQELQKKLTLS